MAKKPYRYTGVLAKPADRPLLVASIRNPDDKELADRAREESMKIWWERVFALYRDCGVGIDEPDAGFKIAMTLAERHVGGFAGTIPSNRGRVKNAPDKMMQDWHVFSEMSARIGKGATGLTAADNLEKRRLGLGTKSAIDSRYRKIKKKLDGRDDSYANRFAEAGERSISETLVRALKAGKVPGLTSEQSQRLMDLVKDKEVIRELVLSSMRADPRRPGRGKKSGKD